MIFDQCTDSETVSTDQGLYACSYFNYYIISKTGECINLAVEPGIEPETAAAVVANCPEICNYCPRWQRWDAKSTDTSHARALDYACVDGAGGCVDLVSSYTAEEWGENFASAQWLSSSCDTGIRCALPGVSHTTGRGITGRAQQVAHYRIRKNFHISL